MVENLDGGNLTNSRRIPRLETKKKFTQTKKQEQLKIVISGKIFFTLDKRTPAFLSFSPKPPKYQSLVNYLSTFVPRSHMNSRLGSNVQNAPHCGNDELVKRVTCA